MSITRRDFIRSLGALAGGTAIQARAGTVADHLPGTLQPFTVELLDMNRGNWKFVDWNGQHLQLTNAVIAYAYPPQNARGIKLCYLCCDPEFPRDHSHGEIRTAISVKSDAGVRSFRVNEPFFSCDMTVSQSGSGITECRLENIQLGPAVNGDRYVEALYLVADDKYCPLWLSPTSTNNLPAVRLLTNRVGNIFTDKDDVRITLTGLGTDTSRKMDLSLELIDYTTKKSVWSTTLSFLVKAGQVSLRAISIPLKLFGIFELSAIHQGQHIATLRICRIPTARKVNPDRSSIGINIFQQQIWWYAFQIPMMAAAGVHWIRPWLAWENIWSNQQPQPDKWDTRALDAALRRMDRYEMRYQNILIQSPYWVAGDAPWGVPPMNRMKEWGEYVHRLVTQYKGRIRHYEVWNEPDGIMWTSEENSSEHYLAMLRTTWFAAKKADPKCTILGLSHAANMDWLKKVCDSGAANYMDIATFHTYASPQNFQMEAKRRIEELNLHHIQRFWINELGVTAYDFNSAYSTNFDCSESKQAITLVKNYAQAMALNPDMKVFWFCTYDPRDAEHESDWAGDAGIGLMYLGFLPKLAYAALAGYAKMTDGRQCLGMVQYPETGLHQVSFEGPVAVAWRDGDSQTDLISATQSGCLADESIVVRDIYANKLTSGKAGKIMLDFSHGPLYIEGSHQMAGTTAAYMAFQVQPDELEVGANRSAKLIISIPSKIELSVTSHPAAGFTVHELSKYTANRIYSVASKDVSERLSGVIQISAHFKPPAFGLLQAITLMKEIPVTANGGPNLIRDGSFSQDDLSAWTIQGNSSCTLDRSQYHLLPGCLKLSAPFQKRLVQWDIKPTATKPLHLKFWVKTQNLTGCRITLNLSWYEPKGWINISCLATNEETRSSESGVTTVDGVGHIPAETDGWKLIDVNLNPPYMPQNADHAAFFIDATGAGSGVIWIDELDMWQP
ncbi:MAG: hypothetical protein ACYC1M_14700 [Armatimonadota bacterium]